MKEFGSDTVGEEAVVAKHFEMFIRDVADEGFDEVGDGESFSLGGIGVMIQKGKSNLITVISQDSGFSERRAFKVFGQVLGNNMGALLRFLEVDVPRFLVMSI